MFTTPVCASILRFDFAGFSMWPTLRPGDELSVVPYLPNESIAIGDVIVFSDSMQNRYVAHRVIEVGQQIRTQGDHNFQADVERMYTSEIVGRVVFLLRNNKKIRVRHGFTGQIVGKGSRLYQRFRNNLRRIGRPFYDKVVCLGWLHIPPYWLQLQVVGFQRPYGTEMILRARGRWNIGVFYPERQYMAIKWPFRLLIQRQSLEMIQEIANRSGIVTCL